MMESRRRREAPEAEPTPDPSSEVPPVPEAFFGRPSPERRQLTIDSLRLTLRERETAMSRRQAITGLLAVCVIGLMLTWAVGLVWLIWWMVDVIG
jgi:hypothetical protein